MSALRRLPRWARWLLLASNLAASLAILVAYWAASYPNLIAAWAQGSALVTLAPPAAAWFARTLDAHQQRSRAHVAAEHEITRTQLAAVSGQVAALHARLDQAGGAP